MKNKEARTKENRIHRRIMRTGTAVRDHSQEQAVNVERGRRCVELFGAKKDQVGDFSDVYRSEIDAAKLLLVRFSSSSQILADELSG